MVSAGRWQLWQRVTGSTSGSGFLAGRSRGSQELAATWSSGSLIRRRTAWLIVSGPRALV